MTDRDNSSDRVSEGFLERWSRKKAETVNAPAETPKTPVTELAAREAALPARHTVGGDQTPAEVAPEPVLDLASLPSLDSITATTDIRAFLSSGVPNELTRAALRRAWSADPAIRDFKGLAENDWDFTNPTAMAGFGELPPGYDVKTMVAQIFGNSETKTASPDAAAEKPAALEAPHIVEQIAPTTPLSDAASSMVDDAEGGPPETAIVEQPIAQAELVQRTNNIAPHNSISANGTDEREDRRQHGGALPQ